MMRTPRRFYHGGVGGLRFGQEILPDMAEHRYVEGCPCCEAQKRGKTEAPFHDPPTPKGWVYGTTNKLYARYYASRAWKGSLYRIQLVGNVERSTEDHFPTWRGRAAKVVKVMERGILLTHKQRLDLYIRWGGTKEEFYAMLWEANRAYGAPKGLQ